MDFDRQALTLLHLSDPQFGPNQRKAQGGTKADQQHDELQERLLQDLEEITKNGGSPRPELVVVTGDLSEHAKPSQFEAFEAFADVLLDRLGLARERLVIVPGNHDVSWSGCQAYFHGCAAKEIEPEPPYWPKWEPYAEMFERWYGTNSSAKFSTTQPYSLFVYEELRTVVAGLNSTMLETHRDGEHYGTVGEHQLRWFRDQLEPYRRKGWLRIATVHHNVQRNATNNDANLHDASDLEWLLADEINLVLHGHTHEGKLGWLRPQIPIVSTGSTSVISGARPQGVPCQYQLVNVQRDGLRRWTRAYFDAQKRFGGDVMASARGDSWQHEHPLSFLDLGAFAQASSGMGPADTTTTPTTKATHTAIVLDRTKAWEALTTTMVETPSSTVFVVYGTWHQDVELFMTRIEQYFNERAAPAHRIARVDPVRDGTRATTAEDWQRAAINATESQISPLSKALFDDAFSQPLLLLLSARGPIRAETPKEQDALVEFVVGLLPMALAEHPPRHPVRVVVPVELLEEHATELVTRLHRGMDHVSNVRLLDFALTIPQWPDVELSLRSHAKARGVSLTNEQLDRCKAHFATVLTSTQPSDRRMLLLGNGLHELYTALLHEAKLGHAPPSA